MLSTSNPQVNLVAAISKRFHITVSADDFECFVFSALQKKVIYHWMLCMLCMIWDITWRAESVLIKPYVDIMLS